MPAPQGEVAVLLTSDAGIRRLNNDWRAQDKQNFAFVAGDLHPIALESRAASFDYAATASDLFDLIR